MTRKTIEALNMSDQCKKELRNVGFRLVEEIVDYVEMLNRMSGSSTFYIRLRSACLAEVEQLVAAGKQSAADDEITCAISTDQ